MENIAIHEWVIFGALVLGMLALDLFLFNRKSHDIRLREAAIWSVVWITMALGFNVYIYFANGGDLALKFLAAYLVEKSLSVDNLFVFLAIFSHFKVPSRYQHRVLFWGVIGALGMRMLFIAAGTALLSRFSWMMIIFGIFLVYTGAKLAVSKKEDYDPSHSPIMKFATRFLRFSKDITSQKFFTHENGVRLATPLLLVLIIVEFSDVLFAFDSVPAVLGISDNFFIVYTSNVFAILGLRALYFLIEGALSKLCYLNIGLAVILIFIGIKMIITDYLHVPVGVSLAFIASVLTLTIVFSLLASRKKKSR